MATQLRRDPFARATLMRQIVQSGPCRWCGQPARFAYGWESDGIAAKGGTYDGPFCTVGCWESYHA